MAPLPQDRTKDTQTPQSPFMNLPPALRAKIYDELFLPSQYIREPYAGPPGANNNGRSLEFLSTCRFFHDDALEYLEKKIFWFSSPWAIIVFNGVFERQPREHVRRITRLSLYFNISTLPIQGPPDPTEDEITESANYWCFDRPAYDEGTWPFFHPVTSTDLSGKPIYEA